MRLYESACTRGPVSLETGFDLAAAYRTNLLEENGERLEVEGRKVRLHVRPYQILTLRLLPS